MEVLSKAQQFIVACICKISSYYLIHFRREQKSMYYKNTNILHLDNSF